jgi:hypothetical protein
MSGFASESQRRKFIQLLDKKVITQEQFDAWENVTDRKKIPVRLKQKDKPMKIGRVRVIK